MGEKTFKIDVKKVANFLKTLINRNCVEGFVWFEDVGDASPCMFDILAAIKILEGHEPREMTLVSEDKDDD